MLPTNSMTFARHSVVEDGNRDSQIVAFCLMASEEASSLPELIIIIFIYLIMRQYPALGAAQRHHYNNRIKVRLRIIK